MTTLLAAAQAFAKAHPTHAGGSWANQCGGFMYELNQSIYSGFKPSTVGPTAFDVWRASDGDTVAPRPWAWAFFANRSGSGAPGHVGQLDEQGYLISATTTNLGTLLYPGTPNLRRMTVPQYLSAHPERKLVGYTNTYGGASLPASITTSGVGPVTSLGKGILNMHEYAINRTTAAGVSQGYFIFNYETQTWRQCGTAESWLLNQEASAGRLAIYVVSDSTWATYTGWKQYVAPVAGVTNVSVDNTSVLKAIGALKVPATVADVDAAIKTIPAPAAPLTHGTVTLTS